MTWEENRKFWGFRKIFGENLKRLREEKKITQEKFAAEIGCSRTTITAYEEGAATPTLLRLIHLAKYFGVTLDELVFGKKNSATDERLEQLEKENETRH